MQLDWEVKNYDFDAKDCAFAWKDIRLIALRSELQKYPGSRSGDLHVTFPDWGDGIEILGHFNGQDNFRHGFIASVDGTSTVHVFLAPLGGVRAVK